MADATSDASARVGVGTLIMDSSICVATILGLPAKRHARTIRRWTVRDITVARMLADQSFAEGRTAEAESLFAERTAHGIPVPGSLKAALDKLAGELRIKPLLG